MELRFNGCEDPAGFLKKKAEAIGSEDTEGRRSSVREYFKAVDEGRAEPVHPVYWSGEYESWDAYKAAAIDEEDRLAKVESMAMTAKSMPVRAVLAGLPGIRQDGARPDEDVEGFVGRIEQELNTKLAGDYRTYLSACGRIAIGNIEHTGIDPSGEYDLVSAIREVRGEFGIPDRYYPLSAVDSVRLSIVGFFQDADGYVYFLDETGLFEPVYDSLAAYIVGIWYAVEGGFV